MGAIFVLLFVGLCMVDVINKKKRANPEFANKVENILGKTDPYFTFFENLITWGLVAFVLFALLR
jgi:hypothetical protein